MPFASDGPAGSSLTQVHRSPELDPSVVVAIFQAVKDSLVVIDDTGIIVAVNDAALRDFGFEREELVGRNVSVLMPPYEAERHDAYLTAYRNGGEAKIVGIGREVDGVRKDGSTFPLNLSVSEFDSVGRTYFLGVLHDITERRAFSNRIQFLARHDEPTGCLNRYGIVEQLEKSIARAPRQRLAVLFVDLDGVVQINDRHGHGLGDGMVTKTADRLRHALAERDSLARVGGNEFVAVVVLDDERGDAEQIAREVLARLRPALEIDGRILSPRTTIGISLYPDHGEVPDVLIDQADIAMYQAKRSGETSVQMFDAELRLRDAAKYQLIDRLREAVECREFVLHYQPQFDLTTLQVTGLEALVRWDHPVRGLVGPGDFIPTMLECGLMPALGRWVLREAAEVNARLRADGVLDVSMAVNICPMLFGDPSFADLVIDVLDEFDLPADRLELEIIETIEITDSAQVAANVRQLRELGVGIAMDDVGTGFSSIQQLRSASFSKLKSDRSFVGLLPGDVSDQAIVTAMLDMADGLGMQAIAEGVETREQWALLRRQGCRYGQGFWYGRPMPEHGLRDWLATPTGPRAEVDELLG